jgi:hypothetical protein
VAGHEEERLHAANSIERPAVPVIPGGP